MSWLRLEDNMLDHPKWRRALREGGDGALLMWWRLNAWCSRHSTGGRVPGDLVESISCIGRRKSGHKQLGALIKAHLLAWHDPSFDSTDVRSGLADPADRERHGGDELIVVGFLAPYELDDRIRREARVARPIAPTEVCAYCGTRPERMTIDHVIPLCQGGNNEPRNLVPACVSCNPRKGGRTPEQAGMRLLEGHS